MKSPIILRIFKGEQLVEVKQFEKDQIVFGHNAEVTVNLNDSSVAPIHALIELRDSGYYICDLGSQSGTFKNGQQILDEPLDSGDEIKIGPFQIAFFVGVPKPKGAPSQNTSAKGSPSAPAPKASEEKVVPKIPHIAPAVEKTASVATAAAATPSRPNIGGAGAQVGTTKKPIGKKSKKTFAPPSEIRDLRRHLKPSKGPLIEVVVSWRERILGTYHFPQNGAVKIGSNSGNDIVLPKGVAPESFHLIDLGPNALVSVNAQMHVELVGVESTQNFDELLGRGRLNQTGRNYKIRLEQNEMLKLGLFDDQIQIFIRYVPAAGVVSAAPALELTGSELTGLFIAFVLVSLMALYVSLYSSNMQNEEEEVVRMATVIFNPPKKETPKPPPPEPEKKEAETPPPTPKIEPPKKIEVSDKKQDAKPAPAVNNPGRAQAIRPKPNKLNRPKNFTSTKQGGAVKTGETAGANAQSQNRDTSKMGLFAALGGGGTRANLDKAYSGSGELLGMADKATGTSGMNEDREGSDLGSKFKDTGAGGKGTATQGIADLGTKGRSSGQSAFGSGTSLGDKGAVSITAGGAGEDWRGSIDKEGVRRVVRANRPEISGCYNRELNKGNKSFEGKVIVKWEIGEQGRVLKAEKVSSTLANDDVVNCLIARLKTWRFPEPPKNTIAVVTFPFTFVVQGN